MPYEYGQIILVPVPDGRGNVEPHPAVILSPSDQIVPGVRLRVVCVSSQLETRVTTIRSSAAATSPQDRSNKPNVAKCNWLAPRLIRTMSSRSWVLPRRAHLTQDRARDSRRLEPDAAGIEATVPSSSIEYPTP